MGLSSFSKNIIWQCDSGSKFGICMQPFYLQILSKKHCLNVNSERLYMCVCVCVHMLACVCVVLVFDAVIRISWDVDNNTAQKQSITVAGCNFQLIGAQWCLSGVQQTKTFAAILLAHLYVYCTWWFQQPSAALPNKSAVFLAACLSTVRKHPQLPFHESNEINNGAASVCQ